ncbi:hypothetical protein ACGFWD_27355 [Streptomyces sp. NPDC048448]|uniref:hypothetical protein n=1 Tax=Streptomyces sp. NPDC048448 TaxID=3365554 RepID=UPI003710C167
MLGNDKSLVRFADAQAEFGIDAQGVAVGTRPAGIGSDQPPIGREGKRGSASSVSDAGDVDEVLGQAHQLHGQFLPPRVGGVFDEGGVSGQQLTDTGVFPGRECSRVVQEPATVHP